MCVTGNSAHAPPKCTRWVRFAPATYDAPNGAATAATNALEGSRARSHDPNGARNVSLSAAPATNDES